MTTVIDLTKDFDFVTIDLTVSPPTTTTTKRKLAQSEGLIDLTEERADTPTIFRCEEMPLGAFVMKTPVKHVPIRRAPAKGPRFVLPSKEARARPAVTAHCKPSTPGASPYRSEDSEDEVASVKEPSPPSTVRRVFCEFIASQTSSDPDECIHCQFREASSSSAVFLCECFKPLGSDVDDMDSETLVDDTFQIELD